MVDLVYLIPPIEWLLLITESVLKHIDPGKIQYTVKSRSHKQLIDWIFNEIFNAGGNCLPLIGTSETIDGKNLENVRYC
jgi:hypothetical protein